MFSIPLDIWVPNRSDGWPLYRWQTTAMAKSSLAPKPSSIGRLIPVKEFDRAQLCTLLYLPASLSFIEQIKEKEPSPEDILSKIKHFVG